MNEPHNERRHYSPSATIVESSRLVPWMLFACIMAGVSLGLSVTTIYIQATAYRELERENRLLQLKVDDMAVALKARGIDPTPSHEGSAP